MDRDQQPTDEPRALGTRVCEAPAAMSAIEARAARPRVRVFRSEALFEGRAEVHIAHGDATYRLCRTSLGKLILVK